MKLFLILGNQLFPVSNFEKFKNDHIFYMAEDYELCSYEKHHKLKILLFLSSMRSHADQLKKKIFKLEYSKIDSNDFKKDYLEKLKKFTNLVLKENKNYNLISKSTENQFWFRHILDSAQLVKFIDFNLNSMADLGTGAGFPGLVVEIFNKNKAFHVK